MIFTCPEALGKRKQYCSCVYFVSTQTQCMQHEKAGRGTGRGEGGKKHRCCTSAASEFNGSSTPPTYSRQPSRFPSLSLLQQRELAGSLVLPCLNSSSAHIRQLDHAIRDAAWPELSLCQPRMGVFHPSHSSSRVPVPNLHWSLGLEKEGHGRRGPWTASTLLRMIFTVRG